LTCVCARKWSWALGAAHRGCARQLFKMDGDLPKHASGPSSENLDHARASDEASESLRIFYSLLKKNRRSILASHFWTQQVRKIKVCRRISRRCPPIDADYAVVNTSRRLSPFVGFAFFASQ